MQGGGVHKKLYPGPMNSYSPVVHCSTVKLVLIIQCILRLHSQIIDFKNAFSHTYIPSGGGAVFVEITRDFKSYEGQCGVVIRLNKIIYDQEEAARL